MTGRHPMPLRGQPAPAGAPLSAAAREGTVSAERPHHTQVPATTARVGVGPPRWQIGGPAALGTVSLLLYGAVAYYHTVTGLRYAWLWQLSAVMALFTVILRWYWCLSDARFVLVASEEGVTQWSALKRRRVTVPWADIGRCCVYTEGDAASGTHVVWCAFLDGAGEDLLRVRITGVCAEERDKFLEMVGARQGTPAIRHELVSAARPPGIGTELQASGPPAGRGTEVEAGPQGNVRRPRRLE